MPLYRVPPSARSPSVSSTARSDVTPSPLLELAIQNGDEKMRALQISSFGNPTDVLELIDIPEPPQPDAGQALVGVEFAPINHNDLLLIKGTFHWTPSLPYVVGNEGVGRVLAVGPTVSNVKVGDRVGLPLYSNTWQERVLVS